jgi:hypothetical protein
MGAGRWRQLRQIAEITALLWVGLLLGSILSFFLPAAHAASGTSAQTDSTATGAQGASISPSIAVSGVQFAREQSATSRVDLSVRWKSEDPLHDLRFIGFFESGPLGQVSLDLDPMVVRPHLGDTGGRFWVGRDHPAYGLLPLQSIQRTSAIGANWVQNQDDALNPRVSGWVGTGIHLPITKELKFSAAFSPLFIPTMSPALRLSETQDATGARFTRLPPTRFQLPSGTILPLRYRLETGQITDIVFQNQAFLGMAYETNAVRASLMTWSGPSASPEVDATGDIPILQETSAVAFAVARPRFPRQNFVGATFGLPSVIASPEMQAILEMRSARWTLSAKLTPVETPSLQIHTGFLSRIAQASSTGASSSGTPGLSSPDYATLLGWVSGEGRLFGPLNGSMRIEQHFTRGERGVWVQPALSFSARENLALFATASIIAGEDRSYFGAWRSLDSVSIGARAIW